MSETEYGDWTVQWSVPLSWAIVLINDAFNNTGLVPKDHKDLISPILRFRNDLHLLTEYHNQPLPAIYKQVSNLKVIRDALNMKA